MANPQALESPHGQGPQDIGSAVPSEGQGPAGGQVPALPAGGAPAQAGDQPATEASAPPQDPFEAELQKRMKGQQGGGRKDPFEEMDPNFPIGYTALSPRMRKTPNGALEILREGGKWSPATGRENDILVNFTDFAHQMGIRAKEDLPRFLGAVAGGALGGAVAGPYGAIAGAGLGQGAAGAIQNGVEGKPITTGGVAKDVVAGAAGTALPLGAGKFLEGQAAAYGAESSLSPLISAGAKVLTGRMAKEAQVAQELGIPVGPTTTTQQILTTGGGEAQKMAQVQAAQGAMLRESRDHLIAQMKGPYEGTLNGEAPNFSQVMGTVMANHEMAIGKIKQQASQAANGQRFDLDPVLSTMRDKITGEIKHNIFSETGRVDANLLSDVKELYGGLPDSSKKLVGSYIRLSNATLTGRGFAEVGAFKNTPSSQSTFQEVGTPAGVPGGAVSPPAKQPGLTLDEMDVFRREFGDEANFQKSGPRDSVEKSFGEVYHAMRSHMDNKIGDVLGKAAEQNPELAQSAAKLMAHKDFYSKFKESAQDLQAKIEHDPTNAAKNLIDGRNPEQVKSLVALLDDHQKNYLAGGYLETLTDPLIDAQTGKIKVSSVESNWAKMDPKVKQVLYGADAKKIDALISYAKAIDTKSQAAYEPQTDGLTAKALGTLMKTQSHGAVNFVSGLFKKNLKARDFFMGEGAEKLLPTGKDPTSLANKQWMMNAGSRVMLSPLSPVPYASKLKAADVMTDHDQSIPNPER